MICEQCHREGRTSRISMGYGAVTCMGWSPFYDEQGVFHSHDPNWTTGSYSCSNGHQWSASTQAKCPAPNCEWNGASGMEAREGGDAKAAPSRSDDSPVGKAETPDTSSHTSLEGGS